MDSGGEWNQGGMDFGENEFKRGMDSKGNGFRREMNSGWECTSIQWPIGLRVID